MDLHKLQGVHLMVSGVPDGEQIELTLKEGKFSGR